MRGDKVHANTACKFVFSCSFTANLKGNRHIRTSQSQASKVQSSSCKIVAKAQMGATQYGFTHSKSLTQSAYFIILFQNKTYPNERFKNKIRKTKKREIPTLEVLNPSAWYYCVVLKPTKSAPQEVSRLTVIFIRLLWV